MFKENGSEYSLLEKIYNALFYSLLEYIHQLSLRSHVKYRNSNFNRIEKIEIWSRHPYVKNTIALNIICKKKYTMPYSTLSGVYKPTQYALSCKKEKFLIYVDLKKSKYYLGTPMLKTKLLWI